MRRRMTRRLWLTAGVASLAVLLAFAGTLAWAASRYTAAIGQLTRGAGDTIFLSADAAPWFRLDEDRHDVPLAAIALDLQHAVVAIEDRRFTYHPGIDPIGIARAAFRSLRPNRRVEGGSTLTQQLARTLFLSNTRTFGRKVREVGIALLLERELTKPQILELYLNRVYLSGGVYGVETMAEHLFRKPAQAVSLPEAAMIAGLIRAPSALSPWSNYEGALDRSRVVLAEMRSQGFITDAQEAAARDVRPAIQPYRRGSGDNSGWAKDFLRQQFRDVFGGDHPPDWRVHTTFDRALQQGAEQAVAAGLARLNRPGLQAALVALDPRSGDILAMVGGADYMTSTFNRAIRSKRQPGSAFKPIVYAAALSRGYSPVSTLDGLTSVPAPDNPEWTPRNADGEVTETLSLRAALVESNNAAAAALQQRITSSAVLRLAGDAGLQGLPDVPSLALGSGEVTPLDLTAAYAMFPGGGLLSSPRALTAVVDGDGAEVFSRPVFQKRVVSEPVAFQMVSMLRDVVDRGTGNAARALGVRGPVGGKTGTTDEYRDAWFIGFSKTLVVGVWVGFDQPAPIGRQAYAGRIAVPIWADFMKRAARVRSADDFTAPAGIRGVTLCSVSHQRPVGGCPTYTEYFKQGDEVPADVCTVHAGAIDERAARAVGGFFRSLGGRLSGLWGGKR